MWHIFKENMWTWMETIELEYLGKKKLHNAAHLSNQTPFLYRCQSDEFAQVLLFGSCGCEKSNYVTTANQEAIFQEPCRNFC